MMNEKSEGIGRTLAGVVFDVDGTLVDSEAAGHRVAFNAAFAEAGLPYNWDQIEYGRLLLITGGQRRLASFLCEQGYSKEEANSTATMLHKSKTEIFTGLIRQGKIPARPGAAKLIESLSEAGIRLAVATTGTRDWVIPLLDTSFGLDNFELILTGSDVRQLKPDPAVYTSTAEKMSCHPNELLSVEDSRNGLVSSVSASIECIVVTNAYTAGQDFKEALAVFDSFGQPDAPARYLKGPKLSIDTQMLTAEVLQELFNQDKLKSLN